MQPVTNDLERMVDMTGSTTHCAQKRPHDNISDSFPSEAKRTKNSSIRKSTTNVAGKSDGPVKATSPSLMAFQLLQHLAPKGDVADTGALDSEEADEVLDHRSALISNSRSRSSPPSNGTVPPEGLLAQGLDILTQYAKEDKRLRSELKSLKEKNSRLAQNNATLKRELGRAKKEVVDDFKTSKEYKEMLHAYAESQRSAFKLSTEGQNWFKDGVRAALHLARGWIRKKHPNSDFSALYLDKDDKDAEDNLDR
ncbi:hypothetical protein Leryth_025591 [Lithospermum erythrorhizon]|nr:hypothetical protein Leryth_025591 [Lithospermum erythrorhizon]